MLVADLEAYLMNYNEMETVALQTGISHLKEILLLSNLPLLGSMKDLGEVGDVLSADVFMKNTEKITFMKHPRFVEVVPHKHDFLEVSYAYKGGFTQVINDQVVRMTEGDLTILDTDVVHTINKATEESIIINILLRKDYFNQSILARLTENDLISEFVIDAIYKPTMNGRYLHFPSRGNEKIKHYIRTAMCEFLDPDVASNEVINCNIILLFTELLRLSKKSNLQVNKESKGKSSLVEILNYMEENYLTATLTEVAEHFHFHPNYFSRFFKENLGKSFSDMIQELRIRQAKLLLENTTFQINHIADEVGYTNFNHFYKKFKEYYQVTPAEYRKFFIEQRDKKN
jgi:AraC family transcriptional regulator, melibiose operon regulatory protein